MMISSENLNVFITDGMLSYYKGTNFSLLEGALSLVYPQAVNLFSSNILI